MASNLRLRAHLHVFARVIAAAAIVVTSLLAFPLHDPMPLLAAEDPPDYLFTLGTRGSDPGTFDYPDDVAIGRDGLIYVADESNYRVQVIDAEGNSVRTPWAGGMFGYPTGVAVDVNGTVHVCDADDSYERITAHDPFTGAIQHTWGSSAEFSGPQGIAATSVGSNVYIYVADTFNKRIRKFSYDPSSGYAHVGSWDGSGTDAGQMWDPRGVAVAPDGSVYVTDTSNGRVIRFTSDGDYLDEWGTRVPGGTDIGEFWDPEGIAVDAGAMSTWWTRAITAYRSSLQTVSASVSGTRVTARSTTPGALQWTATVSSTWWTPVTTASKYLVSPNPHPSS